ncbi:MAG: hypothetical protein M4579_007385 [Chaenotheca gracillima]|nr:MAG: hypothetical protein M4579_007385 [Chaenotheca gracillima]
MSIEAPPSPTYPSYVKSVKDEPLLPTYKGYIKSVKDALLLVEECLCGRLTHMCRPPRASEREHMIQSGTVMVFEQLVSGTVDWNDGVSWSLVRSDQHFVISCESPRPGPSNAPQLMKKTFVALVRGSCHYVVAYYTRGDYECGKSPSEDPEIEGSTLRPELKSLESHTGKRSELDSSTGPWRLVLLSAVSILDPHLASLETRIVLKDFSAYSIPYARKHRDGLSWDLVVVESCLSELQEKLPDFSCTLEYRPWVPSKREVSIYGKIGAQKRARRRFISTAYSAIEGGCGPGPEQTYKEMAKRAELEKELEKRLTPGNKL